MNEAQHAEVTRIITDNGRIPPGVGILPNPYWAKQDEVIRRHKQAAVRKLLTDKIEALTEPRFITTHETSEFIEALITMTDSRRMLEIGVHTGYTTLHMLRAVYGKPGVVVVAVEARPAHDADFWNKSEFREILHFVQGWTPDILSSLDGMFDLIFVDSDHSIEHTERELQALWKLTRPGTIILFHDVPAWQTPDNRQPVPVRDWLLSRPELQGCCFRSCRQKDCEMTWGPDYPLECSPGLGVFIRK